MTENTDKIELRLFARRIGLLDTGNRHLPTDWPTGIGVLPPFTGVLNASVHRIGGPPVNLSYLALAPVINRTLVARGSDDESAGVTSVVSETAADERGQDDRTGSGTELTVQEMLREQGSADWDRSGDDDGDNGGDTQTDPDSSVRTIATVDREWSERTLPGVDPPTVTGPRRTVLDLTSPYTDAPGATDQASSTSQSSDSGQQLASPAATLPKLEGLSIDQKSVDMSTGQGRPSSPDPSTPTGTAPGDREVGGGGAGEGNVDSPGVPAAVEEMATPRLTVHSSSAVGTPSDQVDDAGPTPPGSRVFGQGPPAAAVGGTDVGESTQAVDGEPPSGTTSPTMTVRRTTAANGTSGGRTTDAASGSRTGPTAQGGEPAPGPVDSSDPDASDPEADLLTALRENGDASPLVDELYRRISRRTAIERDRRSG